MDDTAGSIPKFDYGVRYGSYGNSRILEEYKVPSVMNDHGGDRIIESQFRH